MKIALWVGVAALGLLWTGLAALGASLVGWGAGLLASAGAADWARAAAQWPVPGWVSLWVDPQAVRALQEAVLWGLQALQQSLPWVGAALGWLVPLVWVTWGLGLLVLVLLGVLAHVLIGRGARRISGPLA